MSSSAFVDDFLSEETLVIGVVVVGDDAEVVVAEAGHDEDADG